MTTWRQIIAERRAALIRGRRADTTDLSAACSPASTADRRRLPEETRASESVPIAGHGQRRAGRVRDLLLITTRTCWPARARSRGAGTPRPTFEQGYRAHSAILARPADVADRAAHQPALPDRDRRSYRSPRTPHLVLSQALHGTPRLGPDPELTRPTAPEG